MSSSLAVVREKSYQPDWISEADATAWLKVDRSTLFRLRQDGKINFSKFAGTVLYDRNELRSIINGNSTYTIANPNMKLV